MKNAIWIGRRQVRGLVILLALLPLIPTALLIHAMWKDSESTRILAIAEMNEMYRYQLRHAADRFSTSTKDGPRTDQDLVRFLTHVFGESLPMRIVSPDGKVLYQSNAAISGTGFDYQIFEGEFKGHVVTIDSSSEIPIHIREEHRTTIRHGIYALLGTILMAGGVWYAVNRGLRVDESRKDLITTISHEIKTPVAAIKVLTESLESGELDEKKREEYIRLITSENERIEHLANRFLTFGRLEKGQLPIEQKPVEISNLIGDLEARMEPKFRSAEGELKVEGDRDITLIGDPNGLEILFSNIAENALKYGGKPPRALISIQKNGSTAEISFTDDGKGVPESERAAVFRRFYRSEGRLDDGQTGVGLGLAICRRLARLMKGTLTLSQSTRPDFGGAAFVLRLPLANEQN